MADLAKTVEIIFNGIDKTGGTVKSIGDGLDSFATKAEDVLSPLNKVADTVKIVDAAIVGLGVALGTKAVEAAGKFEGQVTEIGTLFGATGEQVDRFSNQIQDYALQSTKSYDDITGAVYSAISAGVDWQNSLEFMNQAEALSVAGKADLDSTTKLLISTLNAYGASTGDAAAYSDKLFTAVRDGQTTLPELAASLGQVTGTAASAGVSIEQLLAALAAATVGGLGTSQAVTGLKAAISNIINPSTEAQKAAQQLGIQFDANALASKGFAGLLHDVYTATNGNVGAMTNFFGSVEGLNVALVLGADKSGVFARALGDMQSSAGTTQQAFDAMRGTFDNVLQTMENGVTTVLQKIGEPLKDEFLGLSDDISGIFKAISGAVDAGDFQPIFDTLGEVFGRIKVFLGQVEANIGDAFGLVDWTKFDVGIKDVADAFGSFFDGVDVSTAEGLAAAMQQMADGVGNLLSVGAGIADQWSNLFNRARPLIDAFTDMSNESAKSKGELLGMADVLSAILPMVGSFGKAIEGLGNGLELFGSIQAAKFVSGSNSMVGALGSLATALSNPFVFITLLVTAAGSAAYGLAKLALEMANVDPGKLGTKIYDLTHQTEDFTKAQEESTKTLIKAKTPTDEFIESIHEAADKVTAFGDANHNSLDPVQRLVLAIEQGKTAIKDSNAAIQADIDAKFLAADKAGFLATAQEALNVAMGKTTEVFSYVTDGVNSFSQATGQSIDVMNRAAKAYLDEAAAAGNLEEAHRIVYAEYQKIYDTMDAATSKSGDYNATMKLASEAANGNATALANLARTAGDYQVQMEKIASDERIKNIQATITLNVAQLQADAKVADAIINGIADSYGETTKAVVDLMSQVTDSFTFADRARISFANKELSIQQQLAEKQAELADAQISKLNAQAISYARGDPIITVQGDGLQPHLEAIMWELLSEIQIKLAQEGGELLTGGCTL